MKRVSIYYALVASVVTACGAPPPATVVVTPPAAPTATAAPPQPTTAAPPTETTAPAGTGVEAKPTATEYGAAAATNSAAPTEGASPTPVVVFTTYQDFVIVPSSLTIKAGTKVVFLIKSASGEKHQPYSSFPGSTDLSGLFEAPGNLTDGTSYSYTFTQPGTFTIRCGYHPTQMVATIEVTP